MSNEQDACIAARAAFDAYAGLDEPAVPPDRISALQVRLARWQALNFGAGKAAHLALGVNEEVGELVVALAIMMAAGMTTAGLVSSAGDLSHAVLKSEQRIRGLDDAEVARAAVADALGDILVFATQLATVMRLDVGVLFERTAEHVMRRSWK